MSGEKQIPICDKEYDLPVVCCGRGHILPYSWHNRHCPYCSLELIIASYKQTALLHENLVRNHGRNPATQAIRDQIIRLVGMKANCLHALFSTVEVEPSGKEHPRSIFKATSKLAGDDSDGREAVKSSN